MSAARETAGKLAVAVLRQGRAALPLPDLLAIVFAILDAFQLCEPEPDDAYDLVAWRPYRLFDWFGTRLRNYRARLKSMAPRGIDHATLDAAFELVDRGDITRPLMTELFVEARTRREAIRAGRPVPPLEGPAV